VDTNLGWKGSEKYVAGTPQVFDFWQGPQERYDILMNNFTEQTWMAVVMQQGTDKGHDQLCEIPATQNAEL
jgi:arylsulfatase